VDSSISYSASSGSSTVGPPETAAQQLAESERFIAKKNSDKEMWRWVASEDEGAEVERP
jgi:hypothetical protein